MLNPGTLCSLLFIQSLLTNTWARDPLNSAPSSRRKALLSRFAETPKESTIFITQCASSGIWTGRELTSRPEPLSLLPPSANPLQVQAPRTTHKGQSGAMQTAPALGTLLPGRKPFPTWPDETPRKLVCAVTRYELPEQPEKVRARGAAGKCHLENDRRRTGKACDRTGGDRRSRWGASLGLLPSPYRHDIARL